MKRGRPRKKHHITRARVAGQPIEDHERRTSDRPIPKSPLDDLPPPNPKTFGRAIKRNLAEALRLLAKFSDSIRAGRTPDWPPRATYELFMAQLRAFRLISKRKENAPAIQLMREIDHRWRGLQVVKTVRRCVEQLQRYIGNSLLGSAIEQAQFERQNDPVKDQLILLVLKKKLANPEDLAVMRNLLPESFQDLDTLASSRFVRCAIGARDDTIKKLRIAVARSAQEYLFTEHQQFVERSVAANRLREFIFGLKHRPYTKGLFGFSEAQITAWDKVDQLEAGRLGQERFRQKQRIKKKRAKKRYAQA
jgi:hypothetical protein